MTHRRRRKFQCARNAKQVDEAAVGQGLADRVTRYDRDIDIGYRYGISIWDIGHQWDIDMGIDMEYGISIWDMVYRYGHPPYRYRHPGCVV
jgi:hypothetical protein